MAPSRTTFHMAVRGPIHVMQRRMVAVLATRPLLVRLGPNRLAAGSYGSEGEGAPPGRPLKGRTTRLGRAVEPDSFDADIHAIVVLVFKL